MARELGTDRTTLAHIRSGRDRLSLGLLHRIAAWFPNDDTMRRLVWDYLIFDVETARERETRDRTATSDGERAASTLSSEAVIELRGIIGSFPTRAMNGTSVVLTGCDAPALSASLAYLAAELDARGIRAARDNANSAVSSRRETALLAMPALLVDRTEFASASMASLLERRLALGKVCVVTCLDRARLNALGGVGGVLAARSDTIQVAAGRHPVAQC
jgi:transcriptional regulator with XRE-family HTH domain